MMNKIIDKNIWFEDFKENGWNKVVTQFPEGPIITLGFTLLKNGREIAIIKKKHDDNTN